MRKALLLPLLAFSMLAAAVCGIAAANGLLRGVIYPSARYIELHQGRVGAEVLPASFQFLALFLAAALVHWWTLRTYLGGHDLEKP